MSDAPPHNLDLERPFSGSMLTYPELLDEHAELGAADFYSTQNGEIFATLTAMRTRGETIDPLNLRTVLHETGALSRLAATSTCSL